MLSKRSPLMMTVRALLLVGGVYAYITATQLALNFAQLLGFACDPRYNAQCTVDSFSPFAWEPRNGAEVVMALVLGAMLLLIVVVLLTLLTKTVFWVVTGAWPDFGKTEDEEEFIDCKDADCPCIIHREEDEYDKEAGIWVDRRMQ